MACNATTGEPLVDPATGAPTHPLHIFVNMRLPPNAFELVANASMRDFFVEQGFTVDLRIARGFATPVSFLSREQHSQFEYLACHLPGIEHATPDESSRIIEHTA